MELTVSFIENNTIKLLALNGRLDIRGTNDIEMRFGSQAGTSGGPVLVDLSLVTFLSSIGLRLLLSNAQALRRKGHQMVLFGADQMVSDVLVTSGIANALPVVGTQAEAIQAAKLPVV